MQEGISFETLFKTQIPIHLVVPRIRNDYICELLRGLNELLKARLVQLLVPIQQILQCSQVLVVLAEVQHPVSQSHIVVHVYEQLQVAKIPHYLIVVYQVAFQND